MCKIQVNVCVTRQCYPIRCERTIYICLYVRLNNAIVVALKRKVNVQCKVFELTALLALHNPFCNSPLCFKTGTRPIIVYSNNRKKKKNHTDPDTTLSPQWMGFFFFSLLYFIYLFNSLSLSLFLCVSRTNGIIALPPHQNSNFFFPLLFFFFRETRAIWRKRKRDNWDTHVSSFDFNFFFFF